MDEQYIVLRCETCATVFSTVIQQATPKELVRFQTVCACGRTLNARNLQKNAAGEFFFRRKEAEDAVRLSKVDEESQPITRTRAKQKAHAIAIYYCQTCRKYYALTDGCTKCPRGHEIGDKDIVRSETEQTVFEIKDGDERTALLQASFVQNRLQLRDRSAPMGAPQQVRAQDSFTVKSRVTGAFSVYGTRNFQHCCEHLAREWLVDEVFNTSYTSWSLTGAFSAYLDACIDAVNAGKLEDGTPVSQKAAAVKRDFSAGGELLGTMNELTDPVERFFLFLYAHKLVGQKFFYPNADRVTMYGSLDEMATELVRTRDFRCCNSTVLRYYFHMSAQEGEHEAALALILYRYGAQKHIVYAGYDFGDRAQFLRGLTDPEETVVLQYHKFLTETEDARSSSDDGLALFDALDAPDAIDACEDVTKALRYEVLGEYQSYFATMTCFLEAFRDFSSLLLTASEVQALGAAKSADANFYIQTHMINAAFCAKMTREISIFGVTFNCKTPDALESDVKKIISDIYEHPTDERARRAFAAYKLAVRARLLAETLRGYDSSRYLLALDDIMKEAATRSFDQDMLVTRCYLVDMQQPAAVKKKVLYQDRAYLIFDLCKELYDKAKPDDARLLMDNDCFVAVAEAIIGSDKMQLIINFAKGLNETASRFKIEEKKGGHADERT